MTQQIIYIPKQAILSPVLNDLGNTVMPIPNDRADNTPFRILMNGQPLSINSFSIDPEEKQFISSEAKDLSQQYFELDYYKTVTANLSDTGNTSQIPIDAELAEIPLYALNLDQTSQSETTQNPIDLLIQMVDDSEYDLAYDGNDLVQDAELKSAITLSVYSDAWIDGQRGWWGDTYHSEQPIANSKLWSLMGKPPTKENITMGKRYIQEATQWMIDTGLVDSLEIETEHHANELDYLAWQTKGIQNGKTAANITLTARETLWQ